MQTRPSAAPRFEDITESSGIPVTGEAADMMYTRYRFAADLAAGKRVLELGCATGVGLGLLGRSAARLVGADYSMPLLAKARQHYGSRIPLAHLTAESLPFRTASFDVVLFFEATYYVPNMDAAFGEIARVLTRGGLAMFVNANPERPDFVTSPYSVHYHSADEFRAALEARGMTVRIEGAFPVEPEVRQARARLVAAALPLARQVMEALHLVPKTLKGRARLKRLVFGRLREVPAEIPEGFATLAPLVPLERGPVRGFKVVYVRACKAGGS